MTEDQTRYKEVLRYIYYFEQDIIYLRDELFALDKRAKEMRAKLSPEERVEVEDFARRWDYTTGGDK